MRLAKNQIIIIIVLAVVIIIGAIAGTTYAIWKQQADTSKEIPADIVEHNPSLQYIVFESIDSNGVFTSVSGNPAVAWAVVGYNGLVAELEIPANYTKNSTTLPVTHILSHSEHLDDGLTNNKIIKSIKIPESVIYIGSGACMGMTLLEKVVFEKSESTAPIIIGDYAFSACQVLTSFNSTGRDIEGNANSYLKGTPLS